MVTSQVPTPEGDEMNADVGDVPGNRLDLKAASGITKAEDFFAKRKGFGDSEAAIRFLTRPGGAPPQAGDEMPD